MRERDDYPAHQELVNETLLALGALQTGAARTAQPKWHRALGLVTPEEFGKAIRFRVRNAEGGLLADVMLGKEEPARLPPYSKSNSLARSSAIFMCVAPKAHKHGWRAGDCREMRKSRHGSIRLSKPAARTASHSQRRQETTEDGAGVPLRRLPDGSWDKPDGAGWLEGFRVCSPKTYRAIRRLISTPPAHCI